MTVQCDDCGRSFNTQGDLNRHRTSTEGNCKPCDDPVECDDCGKLFENEHGLCVHKGYAHPESDGDIECPECGEFFESDYSIGIHWGHMHDGELPDRFDTSRELSEDHIESLKAAGKRMRKDYSDVSELTKRQRIRKRDDHECQICGSSEDLHVHHIDGNHDNWSKDNVITVCESCHDDLHETVTKPLPEGVTVSQ